MPYVSVRVEGGVAAVVLCRGKVNTLRAVGINGKDMLSYSGYLLRKKAGSAGTS
jgi:hypothetical protein